MLARLPWSDLRSLLSATALESFNCNSVNEILICSPCYRDDTRRTKRPTMRLYLLAIHALRTVSALTPRGAAKDPARGRENVGVLGCGTQLGATTYGYLQRLKGL